MRETVTNIVDTIVAAAESILELIMGAGGIRRLQRVELRAFDPRKTMLIFNRRSSHSSMRCDRY